MLAFRRSALRISQSPIRRCPPQDIRHRSPLSPAPTRSSRSFWSQRNVDPGFSYCFVSEIVNNWDIDWLLPSLRSTLKQWCIDLGLWDEDNSSVIYRWHVETTTPDELPHLPQRLPHAGDYEWVGEPSEETPKWLWDSETGQTVPATRSRLREGYMAISYTWGRWCNKNEWRDVEGVSWKVPTVKPEGCDITELLPILRRFPSTRYFWIDVLCINQQDPLEKRQEISKQGNIFAQAKGVLIYLWTIPNGHQLALGLCHLGDAVKWPMRLTPRGHLLRMKNHATYHGRRYSLGPPEERSVTPFAWAIQGDPWFTSLWTMQEMILCPSGILMAKNGEVCTVNSRAVTVAFLATAIELGSQMVQIREELPELDSIFSWPKRVMLRAGLHRMKMSGQISPAMTRLLDAIYELRNRTGENFLIKARASIWQDWKLTACLDTCLSANRCDILSAVTKRQASGRRGEAVLAAMKIAPFEEAFDANGVTASGLPAALLHKVLRADGCALLMNFDELDPNGDTFFSHLTSQSTSIRQNESTELLSGPQTFKPLQEMDWSIRLDETLHIPYGSNLQAPDSRKVSVNVNGYDEEMVWDMAKAPGMVMSRIRKWRRQRLWRNSMWRAFGLDEFGDAPPPDPHDDPNMPRNIQVRFIPLAFMEEPEDTRKLSMETRNNPFQMAMYEVAGFSYEVDDRMMGIIVASDAKEDVSKKRWYKCGFYLSYGEYKPFPVPEKEGMTVGML